MLAGMGLLAACSVALGVGAPVVAPVMSRVAGSLTRRGIDVANGFAVFPSDPAIGELSTPLLAVLLMGLLTVPLVIAGLYAGRRPRRRVGAEVWACGYAPDARMGVSPGGFSEPVKVLFRPFYGVRSWADARLVATRPWFAAIPPGAAWIEQLWDRWLLAPLGRGVQAAGKQMQLLQSGDFRVYCLYIVAALILLLAVAIG
jgi:hydrogenase-4 component B